MDDYKDIYPEFDFGRRARTSRLLTLLSLTKVFLKNIPMIKNEGRALKKKLVKRSRSFYYDYQSFSGGWTCRFNKTEKIKKMCDIWKKF